MGEVDVASACCEDAMHHSTSFEPKFRLCGLRTISSPSAVSGLQNNLESIWLRWTTSMPGETRARDCGKRILSGSFMKKSLLAAVKRVLYDLELDTLLTKRVQELRDKNYGSARDAF